MKSLSVIARLAARQGVAKQGAAAASLESTSTTQTKSQLRHCEKIRKDFRGNP